MDLLIWTGFPSTGLRPGAGSSIWGGRRKKSWTPDGVPGGPPNLVQRKESVTGTDQTRSGPDSNGSLTSWLVLADPGFVGDSVRRWSPSAAPLENLQETWDQEVLHYQGMGAGAVQTGQLEQQRRWGSPLGASCEEEQVQRPDLAGPSPAVRRSSGAAAGGCAV